MERIQKTKNYFDRRTTNNDLELSDAMEKWWEATKQVGRAVRIRVMEMIDETENAIDSVGDVGD